jgi:putative transposase
VSAKRWSTFMNNHREVIAVMDSFTVPTLTFGILHCFFVIAHDRRRIIHCNVTRHSSSAWISQQLREAFPYDSTPSYLIFDRAANFNEEVISMVKSLSIQQSVAASEARGRTHSRTLGWKLQERFAQSCHRTQRTPFEPTAE